MGAARYRTRAFCKDQCWAGARFDNLKKIWSVDKKIEQIWYLDLVSGASETRPVE